MASSIQFAEPDIVSSSLDNLSRLGLINISDSGVNKMQCIKVDNNPLSQDLYECVKSLIKDSDNEKLYFESKAVSMTALGSMFYLICNKDIE